MLLPVGIVLAVALGVYDGCETSGAEQNCNWKLMLVKDLYMGYLPLLYKMRNGGSLLLKGFILSQCKICENICSAEEASGGSAIREVQKSTID